jgi:hypothetical protein
MLDKEMEARRYYCKNIEHQNIDWNKSTEYSTKSEYVC